MAVFYGAGNGDILAFWNNFQLEHQHPAPPNTAYTLQFDENTNHGLIDAYNANSAQFRMDGGDLTQNGTPVTINGDLPAYRAWRNLAGLASKIRTTNDPFTREEQADLADLFLRTSYPYI